MVFAYKSSVWNLNCWFMVPTRSSFPTNWRDLAGWRASGVDFSSPSDQAPILFLLFIGTVLFFALVIMWLPVLRIRIHCFRIRIWQKMEKKFTTEKKCIIFKIKNRNYLSLGLHKGRPCKTWNFLNFFCFLGHLCSPGSGSGFGPIELIESRSNPDPKHR